jgi:hypothetical protein
MTLALALVLAAQAAAAGAAPAAGTKVVPMSFRVQAETKGGPAAKAWAEELRTAVEARKDEFRAPKPGEKPELVVRVDSVAPIANGGSVMNGALVVAGSPHAFNLSWEQSKRSAVTEALARNLRKYAEQLKASPPAKSPAKK